LLTDLSLLVGKCFFFLFSMREISEMRNILVALSIFFFCICLPMSASAATSVAAPSNLRVGDGSTTAPQTTTSISQYGITWKFAEPVEYGQFVNGDYWVVDPGGGVRITEITPASYNEDGNIRHGSMINPNPNLLGNTGYGTIPFHAYLPELNIEESLPYITIAGSSVVSIVSYTNADPRPKNSWVKKAAILTVLSAKPSSGSFRPPYSGIDKTVRHNKNDLDYTKLKSLPAPQSTPNLSIIEAAFQRPWIDHMPGHRAQRAHPVENMPEYGAWMHDTINVAALMLNLNFKESEKEKLLIYFTQLGIDLFGIVNEKNDTWVADGGHSGGRKLPIMAAGLVLNDSEMLSVANKKRGISIHGDIWTRQLTA
jgi:hypothetical protein